MRRCRGEQRNGADREAVTALHALAGVTAVGAEAREAGCQCKCWGREHISWPGAPPDQGSAGA